MRYIAAALIVASVWLFAADGKKDLSMTTETVVTSNGMSRTIVFRAAGDMTSTNKVKGSDLKSKDKIKDLKDKLKIKDK